MSEPLLSVTRLQHIIEAQTALAAVGFDLDRFMNDVVHRMQALTGASGSVIELLEDGDMVYRSASGTLAPFLGTRLKAATSLSGRCVAAGEIMISEDSNTDPRVDAEACRRVGVRSMIVVPLHRQGECVGVLKVASPQPAAFSPTDVETLRTMAGLVGATLGQQIELRERGREEEILRRQAQFDQLTGLPNRTLFQDRLSQAISRQKRQATLLALLFLDLDHFKQVNDTWGHDHGDSLLRLFATRVGALLRQSDTFARLGGDEFTLILEDCGEPEHVHHVADLIIQAAACPFDLGDVQVTVGASIGITTSEQGSAAAAEMIRRADAALYEVKRAGRGGFRLAQSGVLEPEAQAMKS